MAATLQSRRTETNVGAGVRGAASRVEWDRVLAAGAAGTAVGAVTGAMSQKQMGTLENVVAPLVGRHDVRTGWTLHLTAAGITGATFGLLPEPATVPKAMAQGAAFGGAVWLLGPLLGVHYLNDMPLKWGKLEKMSLVGHVMWGAALAGMSTFAVRKIRERERTRSDEDAVRAAVPT